MCGLYGLASGAVAAGFALLFDGTGGPDLAQAWRVGYLLATILLPAAAAVLGAGVGSRTEQPARKVSESVGGRSRDRLGADLLTARQAEVLELAAKGYTNGEIAGFLSISTATVKTHLQHTYEKLGASDRASAVTLALRAELIDP
jgi:DNA-binding NarL/FixJ family response regulator